MAAPRILSGDQGGYASPQGGSMISKIPTWVWYGVGIVAAIFIIMKLRSGGSTGSVLQSGTQGAADASSGLLGAPNAPSTLGVTSPNGSSVNLGNVTLTPDQTAQVIQSIFPVAPTSGSVDGYVATRSYGTLGTGITNAWDVKQGGIPLRAAPNDQNVAQIIGWQTPLQLTGQSVEGTSPIGSGTKTWYETNYQGQKGWVWGGDLFRR